MELRLSNSIQSEMVERLAMYQRVIKQQNENLKDKDLKSEKLESSHHDSTNKLVIRNSFLDRISTYIKVLIMDGLFSINYLICLQMSEIKKLEAQLDQLKKKQNKENENLVRLH